MAQRKTREAPEVVRERVELAAIELFAARGADGTSVGQIAGAVNMSTQAVLYHYGTKAALQDAVTVRILDITAGWLARFATPDNLEVSLDGLTEVLLGFVRDNPWVPTAILRELLRAPEVAQDRFQEATIGWRSTITEAMHQGQELGVIRGDLDARNWFDRVALMLLGSLSFPHRKHPLPPDSVEAVALRAELREAVRIALTSAFVDPTPWLEGRGFESLTD
ncbi:MAG: TetR/AcrR family transcriptional regulator [Deltaproteobacteria bacterium]|nr:TetR/AcrR family transcriptional regulator [Deltaproteobacteria bacterium]